MFLAILIAIMIPLFIAVTAWWSHKYYRGKIHLVWGKGSTLGDESLNEEVEDHRIIKLKLSDRGPSGRGFE
jgi:hypothetical protein